MKKQSRRNQIAGLQKSNRSRAGLISLDRIRAYCKEVAREYRPDKIILFGSYAYGNPTRDSDVDLLVILPYRGRDIAKATEIRSRFQTPFALDLIVRKPGFVASRLRERDMFVEWVINRGRVLYESQHP